MHIASFEPSHLLGVKVHPVQSRYQYLIDEDKIVSGWTAIDDDNALCFGGLVETPDGVGAWLLFTDRMTPAKFLRLYRACRKSLHILQGEGYRVVVDIADDYPQARRMADMLGFKPLRPMELNGREMMRMIDE